MNLSNVSNQDAQRPISANGSASAAADATGKAVASCGCCQCGTCQCVECQCCACGNCGCDA